MFYVEPNEGVKIQEGTSFEESVKEFFDTNLAEFVYYGYVNPAKRIRSWSDAYRIASYIAENSKDAMTLYAADKVVEVLEPSEDDRNFETEEEYEEYTKSVYDYIQGRWEEIN